MEAETVKGTSSYAISSRTVQDRSISSSTSGANRHFCRFPPLRYKCGASPQAKDFNGAEPDRASAERWRAGEEASERPGVFWMGEGESERVNRRASASPRVPAPLHRNKALLNNCRGMPRRGVQGGGHGGGHVPELRARSQADTGKLFMQELLWKSIGRSVERVERSGA